MATDEEKNARSAKIFFWLGLALTIVAVLMMIMVVGELFDGILGGSRAHGTTRANDVVGFYIGVAGQFFMGLIMLVAGGAFIRNKQPAVKNDTETGDQK